MIIALGQDRKLHRINRWDNVCLGGMKIIDRKTPLSILVRDYVYEYCDCNHGDYDDEFED